MSSPDLLIPYVRNVEYSPLTDERLVGAKDFNAYYDIYGALGLMEARDREAADLFVARSHTLAIIQQERERTTPRRSSTGIIALNEAAAIQIDGLIDLNRRDYPFGSLRPTAIEESIIRLITQANALQISKLKYRARKQYRELGIPLRPR